MSGLLGLGIKVLTDTIEIMEDHNERTAPHVEQYLDRVTSREEREFILNRNEDSRKRLVDYLSQSDTMDERIAIERLHSDNRVSEVKQIASILNSVSEELYNNERLKVIDLTKQVRELISQNVSLKEKLNELSKTQNRDLDITFTRLNDSLRKISELKKTNSVLIKDIDLYREIISDSLKERISKIKSFCLEEYDDWSKEMFQLENKEVRSMLLNLERMIQDDMLDLMASVRDPSTGISRIIEMEETVKRLRPVILGYKMSISELLRKE